MKAISRVAVVLLCCWLLAWIVVYRYAILDDSLIHLRYADYLRQVHFITFDGVHRTFGTSSLLFVGLLALLRGLTPDPLLPKALSSLCHLALFAGFAALYLRSAKDSPRVRMLLLIALFLLVPLSAIRWLDDGMETSLVLCLVCFTAWWVHRLSLRARVGPGAWAASFALGFTLVLLRNELGLVAGLSVLVLLLAAAAGPAPGWPTRLLQAAPARSALLLGGLVTVLAIRLVMHSFLPDTALAKSHGLAHFGQTIGATEQVMAGSLIFGLGAMTLWGLSAVLVLRQREARTAATLAANALFPVVLLASAVRGQEIQGVRYFIWTFFFSIVWNALELRRIDRTIPSSTQRAAAPRLWSPSRDATLLGLLLAAALLAVPGDTLVMRRILGMRGATTRLFLSNDLATAMQGETGVAYDVGYIAYFTGDAVCDLNGLINGAGPAAMTETQRAVRCVAEHPDFAYLNSSQDRPLSNYLDLKHWVVCGQYDLPNIRSTDRHYLLVKPENAERICAANRFTPTASPYR